jgi:DNA-binding transcriptional ArsR family regulator
MSLRYRDGMRGDADIAKVASLVADPARARVLLALGDGRALPASVLADEAGVAASTASAHLGKLLAAGLLTVEQHGRHRYFRMSGPAVGEMIEALARVAPAASVKSLREGTKAQAVRYARTCYDHLAGMLGTGLMGAMLDRGLLTGGDGTFDAGSAGEDRLASPGFDLDYRLTPQGVDELRGFGITFESLPRRRPLIRYCIDWSEQRHHLGGSLGAALAERMFDLSWIERVPKGRAIRISEAGYDGLRETFGFELAPEL